MKCSVIICTYNRLKSLEFTLIGYVYQTNNDFELVIINDGGSEEINVLVYKYSDRLNIKLIHSIYNEGRASARNKGILAARGDIIVFADDDRVPCEDFISLYINTLTKPRDAMIGFKKIVYLIYDEECIIPNKLTNKMNNTEYYTGKIMFDSGGDKETFFSNIEANVYMDAFDNYPEIVNEYGNQLDGFHFPWIMATTANMGLYRTDYIPRFDENYTYTVNSPYRVF